MKIYDYTCPHPNEAQKLTVRERMQTGSFSGAVAVVLRGHGSRRYREPSKLWSDEGSDSSLDILLEDPKNSTKEEWTVWETDDT